MVRSRWSLCDCTKRWSFFFFFPADFIVMSITLISHVCRSFPPLCRYIRSERSIILVNFCLSILASNLLILVGQSQTLSKVGCFLCLRVCVRTNPPFRQLCMFEGSRKPLRNLLCSRCYRFKVWKTAERVWTLHLPNKCSVPVPPLFFVLLLQRFKFCCAD